MDLNTEPDTVLCDLTITTVYDQMTAIVQEISALSHKLKETAMYSKEDLDTVFGSDSVGDTPEERAKTSTQMWMRTQDELVSLPMGLTGMVMTSKDALSTFGMGVLTDAVKEGKALIMCAEDEPAASLKRMREKLGHTHKELAALARVSLKEMLDAENSSTITSMHVLIRLCVALDIDFKAISFKKFS
ncbi:MAG: helix-turn-helix transcriptional regulator [Patescibacteria group bacterium]